MELVGHEELRYVMRGLLRLWEKLIMDDQDATMAIQSRAMLSWKGEKGLGKRYRGFLADACPGRKRLRILPWSTSIELSEC